MQTERRVGRTVGLLLLAHLALGLIVPFILVLPLVSSTYLAAAASVAGQIRAAIFLFFVGSAIPIAATIAAWPLLRRSSLPLGLWLLVLASIAFALQMVDNGRILAMVSLSQQYVSDGAGKPELYEALAGIVAASRKWSHYTALFVAVSWISLFCATLFRLRVVPPVLSLLGLVTSLLQIAAVSVRGLLGYAPMTALAVPLAPVYITLALWLIVKGFDEKQLALRYAVAQSS